MKKVSIRAFQLKPYEYLKDLPIMLTRYNKDIAILSRASGSKEVSKTEPKYPEGFSSPVVKDAVVVGQQVFGTVPDDKLSDIKQPGYHFSPILGKYVKDD